MSELQELWDNGLLVGREVEIEGHQRTVVALYDDIPGGIRVEPSVDSFVSWNIADCRLAAKAEQES